ERLFPLIKDGCRDAMAGAVTTGLPHGEVLWREGEKSLLVFAVSHPESEPELDWWQGPKDPPGNRLLARIAEDIKNYVNSNHPGVAVYPRAYHVEKGGVYLKDAAALAGLGVIGKNNLLITKKFGPRVRLRAVGIGAALEGSKRPDFDPCSDCDAPCRRACPESAFSKAVYSPSQDIPHLPARDGTYCRLECAAQMGKNEKAAQNGEIRYCRLCEFACKY
ncbi:MAG: hypothetical protein IKM51_03240, partial [Oscillospiraceae bacterium]|nr:hypothetical protein [Oscillospiraceae bacterium]